MLKNGAKIFFSFFLLLKIYQKRLKHLLNAMYALRLFKKALKNANSADFEMCFMLSFLFFIKNICIEALPERLRGLPAKQLGSARASSNLAGLVYIFACSGIKKPIFSLSRSLKHFFMPNFN
jgi:hypothetical protein